ncbi:MAG: hypothetical protein PVG65_01630 [Candidatus Thorarchaeota archaeon]|jgi:hypothetical protein
MPEIKKIISREIKERKDRRNRTIVGLLLVGLLVVSIAGYFSGKGGDDRARSKIIYNSVEFTLEDNNYWSSVIGEIEFLTAYNPKETEDIQGMITLRLESYQDKPLYFSHDSNTEGINEINMNLGRFASRTPQKACLYECEEDLPVKNCTENIIIVREVEELQESLIRQEENCIYVLSTEGEILKVSDAFIFKLLELN